MDSINIIGTQKTPTVNFNSNGVIEIKGRSIPENSIEFYKPLVDWLDVYSSKPQVITEVNVQLEYFNTSSSKCILDVFKKLEGLQQGAIRESDFLLGILDIAEEHKDEIKALRSKSDEEFEKRKKLREMYEKGDKPEYYRGAADTSIKKDKKEDDYKHNDTLEDMEFDEDNDFDLDFLI